MATEIANIVHAIATCHGVIGEYIRRQGFTGAFNRAGTGDYTLTLLEPVGAIAQGNAVAIVQPNGAQLHQVEIDNVDGSTIRCRFYDDAGVAQDASTFGIVVYRMPQGLGDESGT